MTETDLNFIGACMHNWARELFPITRSLTGPGVRETLAYLANLIPALEIHAVPSGSKAFDWTVPDEWSIRDAYVTDEKGNRVIDFHANNLHVVGYSISVDEWMSLEELDQHLHSLPSQLDAIPYVTSYYRHYWGFCLSHCQRQSLKPGRYRAVIDSTLAPGVLNYAELVLPGREKTEVLISTYICHPSMANNEVSGMVVTAALAQWLAALCDRRHTYRIIFIPETIGSIVYCSLHYALLRRWVVAGYVVTCVGDDRTYSFLSSRKGGTLADRAARHVLASMVGHYDEYSFLDRGSDERQFCSPGIDLPVASVMRSKYATYPEYHTSLDDLNLVTPSGLAGSYRVLCRCLELIEANRTYRNVVLCEPQLGKRGLYPTISSSDTHAIVKTMMDILAYCDGEMDLLAVAEHIGSNFFTCRDIVDKLFENGVLEVVNN